MQFDVVTLFPKMIMDAVNYGITRKAIAHNIIKLSVWNPRDYTIDKYHSVDDHPYGGGPGMIMKYQPLLDAVNAAKSSSKNLQAKVVFLSPQGKTITQSLLLEEASKTSKIILVAGRYKGVDERFVETICDEEWSLGDYIISGGELAALIVIDAITRLIPNVLGDADSAEQDSFMHGLLDAPYYTRPELGKIGSVPIVLLSGNHQEINRWRIKQALKRTETRRPDLFKKLTAKQKTLLGD